jgi:hypothetical protein
LYFHLFLSNLGPNKAHMSSWDTSMFVTFFRYLLIVHNPWTSMKYYRSSSSFEPLDCPCSSRKIKIVKCQNKRNIGKNKMWKTKNCIFWYLPFPYYQKAYQMIELQAWPNFKHMSVHYVNWCC